MKSCNAEDSVETTTTVKNNKNRSHWPKKKYARTLYVHCSYISLSLFARQQRETSRNFLVTSFMDVVCMCSCSRFSFSPYWPLAFLIFSPPLKNFNVFLPKKLDPVAFLFLALALSQVSTLT